MTATIELEPGVVEGVTDHGLLTGLDDDDHPQYAKSDGSRGAFASPGSVAAVASAIADEETAREGADVAHDSRLDTLEALDPILEGDPRLTDDRTPLAHAASHADGGSDELGLDASQTISGTFLDARIPAAIARDTEVASAVAAEAADRDAAIAQAVADLIGGAPGALDALNELAAAIGNDPDFATTITNAIAGKISITGHTANSVSVSISGTAVDLAIPVSTLLGRKAAGDVVPLTAAETKTLLDVAIADVSGLVAALAAKAPLASPGLTGIPTAPTAAQGTNTTQIATTALVQTEAGLLIPRSFVDATTLEIVGSSLRIKNAGVTNAKLANMAASTVKMRKTASTGSPEDATMAELATAMALRDIVAGKHSTPNTSVAGQLGIDVVCINVTEITATGATVYNVPADAIWLFFWILGAGGGGASGYCNTAGTNRNGGGGGGGAPWRAFFVLASEVAASLTITLGAGGAGGIGSAIANTQQPGNPGGTTTISGGLLSILGGAGGINTGVTDNGGGGSVSASVSAILGIIQTGGFTSGGHGLYSATAGTGANGAVGYAPGGGGGGGISAANVARSGGPGGGIYTPFGELVAGGAAGSGAGNGAAGTRPWKLAAGTAGGGGTAVLGQRIGGAGERGAGGGGGAATGTGNTAGNGGNGGDAYALVAAWG